MEGMRRCDICGSPLVERETMLLRSVATGAHLAPKGVYFLLEAIPAIEPEKCLIPVSAKGSRERGFWAETCAESCLTPIFKTSIGQ